MITPDWVSANPGYFSLMIIVLMLCFYALAAIKIMTSSQPRAFFQIKEGSWIQRKHVDSVWITKHMSELPQGFGVVYCFANGGSLQSDFETEAEANEELGRFING